MRHAPKEQSGQAPAATPAHDDGVHLLLSRRLYDHFRRIALSRLDFDIGDAHALRMVLGLCQDLVRQRVKGIADIALGSGKLLHLIAGQVSPTVRMDSLPPTAFAYVAATSVACSAQVEPSVASRMCCMTGLPS